MSRERNVQIEAIYPLSPMQQGLVFHTIAAPGMYVLQSHSSLHGVLDAAAFRRAWEAVVQRHPTLRTLFVLDQGADPLQVVMKQVALPWREEDWRGVAEPEQRRRLAAYHAEDLARGFDLDQAPLLRAALFCTHDEVHHFVWSIHHAIVDGWSGPVIRREVVALYESFVRGTPDALPPPAPYGSFIAWLKEQDPERAAAHWRERLQGFTAATPLPAPARPAPREGGGAIGHHRFTLPPAATAGIRDLARGHQLTLNTMLLGAWAILLARSSGETDVVFGAIQSGRPPSLPGVESMVGLLISTLPVRARPEPGRALMPWLAGLQADLVESREYEYASLVEVHACSDVPRGRPLFETLVVFENYPTDAPASGANLVWRREGHTDSSHYPLTLVVKVGDEIAMRLIYHRDRFEDADVERIAARLLNLLAALPASAERPVGALPLASPEERHRALVEWNDTARPYPRDHAIPALFEEVVGRTPTAVALEFEGERLTYDELNRRANRLAAYLREHGVERGTLVGLCVERSFEMVVGVLGILKAGGAYVPLDPAYPVARLALMIEDTRTPLLLTLEKHAGTLPESAGPVVRLDTDWPRIGLHPDDDPPAAAAAADLAYVIYTSGSTGRPKGAGVEHRSVVRLVRSTDYVDLGPDETMLQFAPISFDASTLELWGSLLNGAKLVIFPPRTPALEELGRFIETHRITTLWLTAALFRQMVDTAGASLRTVGQLLAGGETLSAPHVRRVLEALGDRRLVNGYGPTENTTFTCCHVMTADSRVEDDVPIGRPIANTTVYLLDAGLEPVPPGVPGELYTGGDGVARGYLNDPVLTAQKFVPDPFGDRPGARLYRTGDLARYRPDGTIEFLGRRDHQVKIRGYRIEPGEIEAVLAAHPAVREAVVTVQPDPAGEPHLVASLVLASGDATVVDDVRAYLRTRLPASMVPAGFTVLDRLPLSPNGKVDRRALATPVPPPATAREFVPPQPGEEATVAAIWTETLGVDPVSAHDDFFDLGGHSLKATQVITRIRARLGVELPLESLFDHPTVAGITEQIRTLRWARDARSETMAHADREEIEL